MKILFIGVAAQSHIECCSYLVSGLTERGHDVTYCIGRGFIDNYCYKNQVEKMGAIYHELPNFMGFEALLRRIKTILSVEQFREGIYKTFQYIIYPKSGFSSIVKNEGYGAFIVRTIMGQTIDNSYKYLLEHFSSSYYDLIIGETEFASMYALATNKPFIKMQIIGFKGYGNSGFTNRFFDQISEYYKNFPQIRHFIYDHTVSGYSCNKYFNFFDNDQDARLHVVGSTEFFYSYLMSEESKANFLRERYLFLGNKELPEYRTPNNFLSFKVDKEKVKIFVSLGTELSNMELYNVILNVLDDERYLSIMSTGKNKEIFRNCNKHISDFISVKLLVDQKSCLSEVDLFFSHCGASSLYEAIWYQVPLLMFPQGYDQLWNAKIAESLGIGIIINQHEPHLAEYISKQITYMLGNYDSYKDALVLSKNQLISSMTKNDVVLEIERIMEEEPEKLDLTKLAMYHNFNNKVYKNFFISITSFTIIELVENKDILKYWISEIIPLLDNKISINETTTYLEENGLWLGLHAISSISFAYFLKSSDMSLVEILAPALSRSLGYGLKQGAHYYYQKQQKINVVNTEDQSIVDFLYKYSLPIFIDTSLTIMSYKYLLPNIYMSFDLVNTVGISTIKYSLLYFSKQKEEEPIDNLKSSAVKIIPYIMDLVTSISLFNYDYLSNSNKFHGLGESINSIQKVMMITSLIATTHSGTKLILTTIPNNCYEFVESGYNKLVNYMFLEYTIEDHYNHEL